jgi:hypothetical protein
MSSNEDSLDNIFRAIPREERRKKHALETHEERKKREQERIQAEKRQRQEKLEWEQQQLKQLQIFYQVKRKLQSNFKSINDVINYFESIGGVFFEDFIKHLLSSRRNGQSLYILYKLGIDMTNYSLTQDQIKLFNELTIYEEIKDYINKNDIESIYELFDNNVYTPEELRNYVLENRDLLVYAKQHRRFEIYNFLQTYLPPNLQKPQLPLQVATAPQVAGNLVQIYNKYYLETLN